MNAIRIGLAAAALPAAAMAQSLPPIAVPSLSGARLDVTGHGEIAAAPDIATIGAGVVTQAGGAAAAMADNAKRMAATIAALRQAGVADRDIRTSSLSLSPQYRNDDGQPPRITGYQASNRVDVRFRDVKRAGPILDALVAAGANQIDGPSFTVDKPAPLFDQARAAAVADARAKAELYARAAGLSVKRVLLIAEQGESGNDTPPYAPMMFARAKDASTSIAPGEQKLAVTVSVSFELQ